MRYISIISGVVVALAFAAAANAGPVEAKAEVTGGEAESRGVDVAIDISEKTFHVTKGGDRARVYSHRRDADGHSTSQPGSRGA